MPKNVKTPVRSQLRKFINLIKNTLNLTGNFLAGTKANSWIIQRNCTITVFQDTNKYNLK